MAIRINGSGEYLRRTANLPSSTAFTVAAWVNWTSIRNTYSYVFALENATSNATAYCVLGHPSAGTLQIVTDAAPANFATNVTAGVWNFVALTCSGTGSTGANGYWRAATSGAFTTVATTGTSFTPAALYIGNDSYDEWTDTLIGPLFVFNRALTEIELLQLSYSVRPVVTGTMPVIWSPLWSASDVKDYSGNGRNWTASGTLSDEDGPPVSWGAPIWVVPFAATGGSALEGTLSATLGGITSVATGTSTITGTAAPTLGALTLAATGGAGNTGTLAGTLGAMTVTAAGTLAITGTAAPTLGNITLAAQGYLLVNACVGGVLRQNTANGRYFENDAGPIVLAGSHTWYNTQDGDSTYPPDPFEWNDYLTRLVGHGHNFTLLWRLESARDWPSDNTQRFGVQPYARTGPGNAADGQLKFDLNTWDSAYFERLLQRVITAGNAGLYVGLMLFQGWHIDATKVGSPSGDPWAYHPFNAANNINSVDGDGDDNGIAEELRDTTETALYNRSKAFVAKMIDTLNHLDNVIWEIENEGGTYSVDWQHDLIDYIHIYEAGKPKQHPVGMVKIYPGGNNTDLTSSNADWISPDDDLAPDAVTSTTQVRAYDTDHSVGDTDTFDWVFRALTRGYGGIWYMDPWDSPGYGDTRDNATYELIRATLGYALDYAARLDLENATPQGSLSSTGYCIAKTTGGAQLLAYQDGTGAFDLTLTSVSGTFSVEWLRISTGATQAGSNVTGGGVRTLTPPWSGEVVAFLELTGTEGSAAITLSALTATGAGTSGITGAAAITLVAVTATAAATVAVHGSGAGTLAVITTVATAAVAISGAGAATLDAITLTATTSTSRTGSLAATLDGLTVVAAGAVAIAGQLTAALADLAPAATGAVAIAGSAAGTLEAVTLAGTAVIGAITTGQLAATLDPLTATATGTVAILGQSTPALDGLTLTAAGALPVAGQAAVTLADITVFATTSAVTFGAAAVTLAPLTATATGMVGLIIAVVTGTVRGPSASGTVRGVKARGTVKG